MLYIFIFYFIDFSDNKIKNVLRYNSRFKYNKENKTLLNL